MCQFLLYDPTQASEDISSENFQELLTTLKVHCGSDGHSLLVAEEQPIPLKNASLKRCADILSTLSHTSTPALFYTRAAFSGHSESTEVQPFQLGTSTAEYGYLIGATPSLQGLIYLIARKFDVHEVGKLSLAGLVLHLVEDYSPEEAWKLLIQILCQTPRLCLLRFNVETGAYKLFSTMPVLRQTLQNKAICLSLYAPKYWKPAEKTQRYEAPLEIVSGSIFKPNEKLVDVPPVNTFFFDHFQLPNEVIQ